jgi:hypothetical protein
VIVSVTLFAFAAACLSTVIVLAAESIDCIYENDETLESEPIDP